MVIGNVLFPPCSVILAPGTCRFEADSAMLNHDTSS